MERSVSRNFHADHPSLHHGGERSLRRLHLRPADLAHRQPGRVGRLRDEGPAGAGSAGRRWPSTSWRRNTSARPACRAQTERVPEEGVPEWLQRSVPAAGDPRDGQETDARQVFRRLAGCWTYWGWKGGYFSSGGRRPGVLTTRSATCWRRRWRRRTRPQWFNTGLHWAYGIEGPPQGHYYVDPQTRRDGALHLGLRAASAARLLHPVDSATIS